MRATWNLANQCEGDGDIHEATRLYGIAASAQPPYPLAVHKLSLLALKAGDRERSKLLAEQAADLGVVDAAHNRGVLAEMESDVGSAKYWWERADAMGDGHGESAYSLGVHAQRDQDVEAARRWLARAADLGNEAALNYVRGRELLERIQAEGMSTEELQEVLDLHANCFGGELCPICTTMDWEGEELLIALAGNSALSPAQQERVITAAVDWQGRIVRVLEALAGNPAISDESKSVVLAADEYVASHVGDDLPEVLESLLLQIESNPRFTGDEWEQLDSRGAGEI
jgi:hypothetical protein